MEDTQSTCAPPSKCTKTKEEDEVVELPNQQRTGTGSKFTNRDLPPGCQGGNRWRSVFIPSVAHWCRGNVDPWTIEVGDLRDTMQAIWDEVYRNQVVHHITLKGAVFHVVRCFKTGILVVLLMIFDRCNLRQSSA